MLAPAPLAPPATTSSPSASRWRSAACGARRCSAFSRPTGPPGDPRILNNMAVAYEALGNFEQALEYLPAGAQGRPRQPRAEPQLLALHRVLPRLQAGRAAARSPEEVPAALERPASPRRRSPRPGTARLPDPRARGATGEAASMRSGLRQVRSSTPCCPCLMRSPRPRRLPAGTRGQAHPAGARPARPARRRDLAPAPFLVVREEGEEPLRRQGLDVQGEFDRYLERLLKRETRLKVIEIGPVDYPTYDCRPCAANRTSGAPWASGPQADLILAGSLDFDIQDRSGYRTEEYVSPFDGRTYQRQVLVEETGFEYDIVMQVYRRPHRRAALLRQLQGLQAVRGREGRSAGRHVREPLLAGEIASPASSPRRRSRRPACCSPNDGQARGCRAT